MKPMNKEDASFVAGMTKGLKQQTEMYKAGIEKMQAHMKHTRLARKYERFLKKEGKRQTKEMEKNNKSSGDT